MCHDLGRPWPTRHSRGDVFPSTQCMDSTTRERTHSTRVSLRRCRPESGTWGPGSSQCTSSPSVACCLLGPAESLNQRLRFHGLSGASCAEQCLRGLGQVRLLANPPMFSEGNFLGPGGRRCLSRAAAPCPVAGFPSSRGEPRLPIVWARAAQTQFWFPRILPSPAQPLGTQILFFHGDRL